MSRAGDGIGSDNWSAEAGLIEYMMYIDKYGNYMAIGMLSIWLLLCIIGFFPGTSKYKKVKSK